MITQYNETMILKPGGYRNKNSTPKSYRPMEYAEACKLTKGDVVLAWSGHNTVVNVKVTSTKLYKRRRDVVVHVKYGLYEYGTAIFKEALIEGTILLVETSSTPQTSPKGEVAG